MNKHPLVSVIVPIYKVEKYLRQCVDSILAQTLQDIEVILVDDGSPDACPQICDEYAKKDSRVKVIHQKNGGLGAAYNAGIKAAAGIYTGFVESDDWIEPDMYENLSALAQQYDTDLVKCDFYMYDSHKTPASVPYPHGTANLQNTFAQNQVFNIEQAPLLLAYHSSVWAGLYKTDFLKKQRFMQTEGAAYVDFPFMFHVLLTAKRLLLTYSRFYHYRMEEGQVSSTKKPGLGALRIIDQILQVRESLQKQGLLDKYAEEFYYHATKCCCGFFYAVTEDTKELFYRHMQKVYAGFPKKFSYRYFEEGLVVFAKAVLRKDKDCLFHHVHRTPRKILVRLLSCLIPSKRLRKKFRQTYF